MKLTLKKMAFVLSLGLGIGVSSSASAFNDTLCDTYARKCALGVDRACELWELYCNIE